MTAAPIPEGLPDLNVVYSDPFALDAVRLRLYWLGKEFEAKTLDEKLAIAANVKDARETGDTPRAWVDPNWTPTV